MQAKRHPEAIVMAEIDLAKVAEARGQVPALTHDDAIQRYRQAVTGCCRMIRYSLILCDKDHEFDGWFGCCDSFDDQAKRGLVECPMCGSVKVQKALMTPGVPARSNRKGECPGDRAFRTG